MPVLLGAWNTTDRYLGREYNLDPSQVLAQKVAEIIFTSSEEPWFPIAQPPSVPPSLPPSKAIPSKAMFEEKSWFSVYFILIGLSVPSIFSLLYLVEKTFFQDRPYRRPTFSSAIVMNPTNRV